MDSAFDEDDSTYTELREARKRIAVLEAENKRLRADLRNARHWANFRWADKDASGAQSTVSSLYLMEHPASDGWEPGQSVPES